MISQVMRRQLLPVLLLAAAACSKYVSVAPRKSYFPTTVLQAVTDNRKEDVWVFILAGQSNMAGRALVEPADTVPDQRILSINKNGVLIVAKEPLHFYEPSLAGLDCGVSFARTLLKQLPPHIKLLIVPTAVGGSSLRQWLDDSLHRNVQLYSNFLKQLAIAKEYGTVKGILWHQGESDANETDIPLYTGRLVQLFSKFRADAGNARLPILAGELGSFIKYQPNFTRINRALHAYALTDTNCRIISTHDLRHKGDSLHFNSAAQRLMGRRFATAFMKYFLTPAS